MQRHSPPFDTFEGKNKRGLRRRGGCTRSSWSGIQKRPHPPSLHIWGGYLYDNNPRRAIPARYDSHVAQHLLNSPFSKERCERCNHNASSQDVEVKQSATLDPQRCFGSNTTAERQLNDRTAVPATTFRTVRTNHALKKLSTRKNKEGTEG